MESKPKQNVNPIWTAVVCGMASYVDAAIIVSWSIVIVIYQKIYSLTPGQIGIISGLLTFGIALGAILGGFLGDKFGRRSVFMFTMFIIIFGIIGLIFAKTFIVISILILLVGLATGADLPVSLTLISEASKDEKQRGSFLGLSQVLWLVGIAGAAIFGMLFGNMGKKGAIIILAHIAVVAALIVLGRTSIPESTVWREEKEKRFNNENKRTSENSILKLFNMPYILPFIALIIFYGLSNAAYNVYGQFGTYILVNIAKENIAKASSASLITLPIGVLASLIFMNTVRSKRRHVHFLIGVIAICVGMLIPVIFNISYLTYIISLLTFSFAAAFAGEAIMKVWCQESFPTMLRATAQGSIIAIGRFSAAGFATLVPLIINISAKFLFVIMTIMVFIGGFTAWIVFKPKEKIS